MLRVLVVDDSLIMIRKISIAMEALGHKVVGTAESAQDAIVLTKRLKPDLITMDITMHVMSGITGVEKIMLFDARVKIIMVTSHGQKELVSQALKAGAKGYVLKPVTQDKLSEAIDRIYPGLSQGKSEYAS